MTIPDIDPDTWHTGEPAANLADDLIGRLYNHPDARERYAAVNIIADRLQQVRAVTAKQLELELGGVSAAADALGVSRQAITELYAKTNTPGPRADRDRAQRPAHLYGAWLAAVRGAAEAAGAIEEYLKRERQALQTTTVLPAVAKAADGWLTQAGRRGVDVGQLRIDVELAEAAVLPWVTASQRHLTLAEQSDAILGYHTARAKAA